MTRYTRYISPVIVLAALLILVRCGKDSPTRSQPQAPTPARITATQDSVSQPKHEPKHEQATASTSITQDSVSPATQDSVSPAAEVAVNTSDSDRAVLTALYNATNGPNWTNNMNWLSERPLGEWHGVTTGAGGRVTALELTYNKLNGPIPAELGSMEKLEKLDFHFNRLNGSIPPVLGKLSNLGTLWLAHNDLSGSIPDELGSLVKLWQMSFANNPGLSGALPMSFVNLPLRYFYVGGTAICAPMNTEFQAWLRTITEHDVTGNCFDFEKEVLAVLFNSTGGPDWMNNEKWLSEAPLNDWFGVSTDEEGRVQGLDLPDNNLKGSLPPEISGLPNLRSLNLSGNDGLSGQLPLKLAELDLESLNLEGTGLCAKAEPGFQDWLKSIPDRYVADCVALDTDALVALVGLYTSAGGKHWTNNENWLSQAPLSAWYGVTADDVGRVAGLDLSDNNLGGSLPSSLSKLADLKKLDLGSNAGLLGPIPETLTTLAIESLNLAGTGLCLPSDSGHRSWLNGIGDTSVVDDCTVDYTDWEALVTFYSETNGPTWAENTNWLSAEPLDEWFGVSTDAGGRVTHLDLSFNNLLGPLPVALGDLDNLEFLNLAGNELSGPIPPELGRLERLKELNLLFCWISGSIPPEIGNLSNLESLVLAFNGTGLAGTLPAELGRLANLRQLILSENGFHGPIPADWGRMSSLELLQLSYNSLSGSVPGELGQLANLTKLYISGNEFSGRIPRELGRLTGLKFLDMSRNRLAGRLPKEIGALTDLSVLSLGRNELTGSIPGELSQMAKLETLDLSYNQFTGSVPGVLGRLTGLRELVLAGNTGLTGPLPAEFAGLNLETLMLGETRLCAPRNVEFQDWLRFVQNSRVASCAAPVEAAAYLTQASQSLDHPVPLVAGEDALLRVFLKTDGTADIPMPPVRASFYRGGGVVYVADSPGEISDVPASFDDESLTATANVHVPGSVVVPGIEVVVEIDPDDTLGPSLGIAGRIPETGRISVDVRDLPTFDLTLVPYLWVDGPDHSVLSAIDGITPESDLMRPTRDLLPVNDFELTVHAPVWTSVDPNSDNVGTMGPELEALYAVEGETGYYMGLFRARGSGGLLGIAAGIPSYLSFSILDPFVIAHEIGHNLNLFHAPCGGAAGPDPFFPYDDGTIGVSGFDMMNESLVSPQTWDLMSYCEPMWISDYSFTRALSHRIALGATIPPGSAPVARGLLLWGGLDEAGELTLEPAFVVEAPIKLPETDGPYTITGVSVDGSGLFSLSFAISEYADTEGGSFAFILPVRANWPGNLARITLSGPEGFAEIDRGGDGEADRHMALMRDEVTGEVRGIFRDWLDPSDSSTAGRRIPPEPGMEISVSGGVPGQDAW